MAHSDETLRPNETLGRAILGPSLQTASIRMVALLGAFAFLGAAVVYLTR